MIFFRVELQPRVWSSIIVVLYFGGFGSIVRGSFPANFLLQSLMRIVLLIVQFFHPITDSVSVALRLVKRPVVPAKVVQLQIEKVRLSIQQDVQGDLPLVNLIFLGNLFSTQALRLVVAVFILRRQIKNFFSPFFQLNSEVTTFSHLNLCQILLLLN